MEGIRLDVSIEHRRIMRKSLVEIQNLGQRERDSAARTARFFRAGGRGMRELSSKAPFMIRDLVWTFRFASKHPIVSSFAFGSTPTGFHDQYP